MAIQNYCRSRKDKALNSIFLLLTRVMRRVKEMEHNLKNFPCHDAPRSDEDYWNLVEHIEKMKADK